MSKLMDLERLRESALQSCRIKQDAPVLVGVSGGPDSLCLLDGFARLGFPVVAAHFDHHLRPESGQDAEFVRSIAGTLKIPFVLGSGDVARFAREEHFSLEEAARVLRYRFLFEQARLFSAQAVAVGHTADDQVETVLMHLLRGAGLNGLQGMRFRGLALDWDGSIPLVRPLLGFWRAETLAYCQERGLQPVFDPTNQDVAFFRNRLRHELIPALESYQPQVRQNIWRMAQILAGEEAVLQAVAQEAWNACLDEQGAGYVALRQEAFLDLVAGLQRRVLRQAIGNLSNVDFEAVERAIHFAQRKQAGSVDLTQGMRLVVEGGRVLITQGELPSSADWPQLDTPVPRLAIPGETMLNAGWRLESRWVEQSDVPGFSTGEDTGWEAWIAADALPAALCLRCARPGDRFQPFGMDGHSLKLSDFWINQKLPRRARAGWPLVVSQDSIVWVPGFRLAHPYRVQNNTRKALHLRLFRVKDEKDAV